MRPPDIEPGTAILAAARKHRAIKGLGRLDFDPSLHHGRPFSSAGFRPDDQSLRAEVEVWYERTWLPRSSWKNWSARLLTTHGFADSVPGRIETISFQKVSRIFLSTISKWLSVIDQRGFWRAMD